MQACKREPQHAFLVQHGMDCNGGRQRISQAAANACNEQARKDNFDKGTARVYTWCWLHTHAAGRDNLL